MKPTLLILAAGMGSRYGGIKQLDALGPNGETIMDYSIFDALRSGFGKVVFIIRKSIEKEFIEIIINKYKNIIPCEYVYQEIDKIPTEFQVPSDRIKPWGTGHAVLMAADIIHEPFAVINADDFYGADAFQKMGSFLQTLSTTDHQWSMMGYQLKNTLSEFGYVSRGICQTNQQGILETVTERTKIKRFDDGIIKFEDENQHLTTLDDCVSVSMNFWGFTPIFFHVLQQGFTDFLKTRIHEPKSEYYIPTAVNQEINAKHVTVRVIETTSTWFGVTYQEDKPTVQATLRKLTDEKLYPSPLFQ
ncbi:MAG: sugar phosphate nucleotidyltransferase [Bacteroidales bacterium]|nr:sugar phosphate nucleotidyltransferase [Bacteroidales bacterium]